MVAKEVKILPEKSMIKIIPYSEMIALGYEQDHPEICIQADKVYLVKGVRQVDPDLRHIYVYGTSQVFIDADIASTWSLD